MSRCFSYPPPGYTGNQGSGQALIESIKLQRERELAKAETKKDRKREKKEKRKEKKGKSKSSLLPEKKIHKSSLTFLKSKSLQQLLLTENEQLERSSLTEEHAQPAGEQKPTTSSDSTQNSSKRKREASPPAVARQEENSLRSNGNVIRIRLSSQKQNVKQNLLVSRQEPCSTSVERTVSPLPKQDAVVSRQEPRSTSFERTVSPFPKQDDVVSRQEPWSTSFERTVSPLPKQDAIISRQEPCSSSGRTELDSSNNKYPSKVDISSIQQGNNNVALVFRPKPETEVRSASIPVAVTSDNNAAVVSLLPEGLLPPRPDIKTCSTSGGRKAITLEEDIAIRDPKLLNKKLVKAELRYRDLVLNWVTPPPQMELDDQDWLFRKKKNPDNQSEKRLKPTNNVSCGSSYSLYPCAQFIQEADIYALPFTVPF